MNTMIRAFKKFILRKAIERCEYRQIKLDAKTDRYHEKIIKKIRKGDDKLVIEKLKYRRDLLSCEIIKTIEWKYKFRRALTRV